MANPSNWTATGYATIAVNGVQFPTQRQILNFPAGTVVEDDPVNAMTDITPAGGGGTPTPIRVTSGTVLDVTDLLHPILADTTGAPFTLTLPAISVDGIALDLSDPAVGGSWQTHALSLLPGGGARIEYPNETSQYAGAGVAVSIVDPGAVRYRGLLAENRWQRIA